MVWDGDGYGLGFGGVDDAGGPIGVDLGQAAQKQAIDVSQDGSAARGDAVLGQEFVEMLKGNVDALGGLKTFEVSYEFEMMIRGLFL